MTPGQRNWALMGLTSQESSLILAVLAGHVPELVDAALRYHAPRALAHGVPPLDSDGYIAAVRHYYRKESPLPGGDQPDQKP